MVFRPSRCSRCSVPEDIIPVTYLNVKESSIYEALRLEMPKMPKMSLNA